MHISEQVAAALIADGWAHMHGATFSKLIPQFAGAGMFSNGTHLVTLSMDPSGRWLERSDGWGDVEREVDLRDWANDPAGAIAAALE